MLHPTAILPELWMTDLICSQDNNLISRRSFLKTATGAIGLSVIGLPFAGSATKAMVQTWSPVAELADQRIEGIAKVTGQKIFARDYNARDLHETHGWPKSQWYALFLRALTTTRAFEGVDLSELPTDAHPVKIVLGDNLATGQINPILVLDRDRIIDEKILKALEAAEQGTSGNDFDRPQSVMFDLVVRTGNRPDFLGQATALLLFDNLASYRKARQLMQFNDAAYQVYGPEIGPNPAEPKVFQPETHYVRDPEPYDPKGFFSYYTRNEETYKAEAPARAKRVDDYLANEPGLIKHEFTSSMGAMDPMFMEPESGLIWFDERRAKLNVLLGTQSPDGDVADIAQMYGDPGSTLKVRDVELISCYPGGGFGGRDSSPFSLMLALCADFADGNAVKLEYDRFEQFRVGLKRHACDLSGTIAASADQKLQVIKMDFSFDGGGQRNLSPYVASLAALCAGGSYDVARANIFANARHSIEISGGSQRGFGGPQAFFAIETAMDQLAKDQGWDVVEFRRRNLLERDKATVVGGPVEQDLHLHTMLDMAEDHPLWRDREALKQGFAQRGLTYGTGLAMSLQAYGTSGDGVVAAIRLMPDGSYDLQSGAVDMGNGSATTLAVVMAHALGANASTVKMGGYTLFKQTGLTADSKIDTKGHPTWQDAAYTKKGVGSSSACLTGLHQVHVVQQVAELVKANTIMPAARIAWGKDGITERDVRWVDGYLVAEGLRPLSLPEIASVVYDIGIEIGVVAHAYYQARWVEADFDTNIGTRRYALDGVAYYPANGGPAYPVWRSNTKAMRPETSRESRYVWAPCVNIIGLTVDQTHGTVQIENVVSVLNAGKVHVEPLVSGQSQGGVAMAIGYTLHEDIPKGMAGPAGGTWNLNKYHVPRYTDVPLATAYAQGGRSQELIILPEELTGETQGRGIAEAVMCSIPPAISNALHDAVGTRYMDLPITPDKVLKGLKT